MTGLHSRREMASRGRLGALVTLSRCDPVALTSAARAAYRASFVDHSACAMCGHPDPLPEGLSPEERARRASVLHRLHMLRLARRTRTPRMTAAAEARFSDDLGGATLREAER